MKILLSAMLTLFVFLSQGQNALNFAGGNDVVQTTFPGILGTANRTFEAWIFVPSTSPASNLCILDYGQNAVGSRNTFYVSGTKSLGYISGGTNANIGSGANAVPVDQWAHVAFVLNNGVGYLYVNGSQVGTGSLTTVNTPAGGSNLLIGERVSGGSIPFVGSIDEVRIWNVARNSTEINANMNFEYCLLPSNLMAYYKLNEGIAGGANSTVLIANDAIANNNGTLSGFALTGATSNWVMGSGITLAPIVNVQIVGQCPGTTYTVGSNSYSSPGTYYDTLIGQGVNGCDSVVITTLGFYTISNDTTNTNICSGDSVTIDGVIYYSTTGIYSDTLTSILSSCDSIVTINLTVNSPSTSSQTFTECEGFVLNVGSNSYTTTGVYVDTLFNANMNGCDSIVNSSLTIVTSSSSSQTITLCSGGSLMVGSNVYTATGNYVDTLVGMASSGCDSIVSTSLTVNSPVDASVTNNTSSFTITANNAAASSYQWIDCNSGTDISGETSQSLLVTANGSYAVIVTEGNCSDTSVCEIYSTIGLNELVQSTFEVFPNPSAGSFTIQNVSKKSDAYDLRIINLLGQTVYTKMNISPKNPVSLTLDKKGVYFIEIEQGSDRISRKLVIH